MNVGMSVLLTIVLALCYHHNGAFSVRSECDHGTMSADGISCVCEPCWTGTLCNKRANRAPYFPNNDVEIKLQPEHLEGDVLFPAVAFDADIEHCPHEDKHHEKCPCSALTYFITKNNDDSSFNIDTETGELTLNLPFTPLYHMYHLQIGARDADGNDGTMLLRVDSQDMAGPEASSDTVFGHLDEGVFDAEIPHHLHKRAITLPTNATFSLVKYGENANLVDIRVGARIQFRLEITFPAGDTDMQVELFAPDSDEIVMMLCEVVVTKGDNLVVSGTTTPDMESMDNSVYNDRAIIALGTVTNNGGDLDTDAPSMLTIEYEAVMIEGKNTIDSTEYWVSAGAEFNNKNDVWVGQASFTAKTDDDSAAFTTNPEFNLQGPNSLEIGQSALYSLDMYIPNPIVDLELDVFASVNVTDVMSICGGKLVSVSDSYSCSIGDLWSYEPQLTADGNTKGFGRLHMSLGRPINKLARESSTNVTDQRLSFQFLVKMQNDETLIGNPYWLGTSVQIGTSKIWAGQIQVSAVAQQAGTPVSPTFTTSFIGNDKVSTTDLVRVQLDVDIPENSNADYTLEILAPFNDTQSLFQVCSVSVIAVGENLGCLSNEEIEPVYTKSDENTLIPDKVDIALGKITNVGAWGWINPNNTTPRNVLSLAIVFKGTNHSLATEGSIHDVILGMYVGTTRLVVGKVSIEVGPPTAAPAITPETTPSFNMYFIDGANEKSFGEAVKFILDVTTVRNVHYSPMDFEFIMANKSGSPMAHICKVELEEVGLNTPCIVKDYMDSLVTQIASFGDNVYDRALLNLDSMCNIEVSNDTAEDHVKLGVSVVLLDQAEYQTDNKTWLSAGVMYSPTTLWVGQLAVYAKTTGSPPSANQAPYLAHVPYNSSISHVPNGYPVKHLIRIKMAPNETTSLKLNVTALDDAVSICGLRYARAGRSYPCADSLLNKRVGITTDEDHDAGINKEGFIDLGLVANVGSDLFQQDEFFDENTLEVELIAKMTIDSALAPDNSDHEVQLVLTYDLSPEQTMTSTVTLTATSDTSTITDSLADNVNASSAISSISGTNDTLDNEDAGTITFGESKRVLIFIETELNTTSQLTVKMLTPTSPADIMNVDYLGVYQSGSNIPCLKIEQTSVLYEPKIVAGAHKDVGSLNLGYVCNTGLDTTDPSANTVTIEGVIRLDRDAEANGVSIGNSLTFHTSVNSNDQELHIFSHILTVSDPAIFTDYFQINETAKGIEAIVNNETDPITMTIGEEITIPIVFTIPPYMSARVTADIRMPTNTSAILTVNDVKIVASGKNVPDMDKMSDFYTMTKSRKFNTSQITGMDFDFGVISNAGMSQRTTDYIKWDDTFTMEVTIQMADNELSAEASTHKVSFGLDVSKFIYILDVVVTVSRTGSEAILFNVTSAVDDVNSTATRIEVDTMIAHELTSAREGLDCIFNIFLPPYVSYIETIITSPYKQIEDVQKDGNAITISLGPLYFTDTIYMTTVIVANATYKVPPGISGSDSVFQFQVVADTFDQFNLTSDLDYLNFTTTTTAESGSSCTPGPLGMQASTISDCQISASRDSITAPTNGRRVGGSGWAPFIHAGKVREERYFQVYFGHKTLVHSFSLEQTGTDKATKMMVRHSDDGIAWVEDPENEIAVDPSLGDQELAIPKPVSSRYLRVMVTDTNASDQQGLYKFEFNGCVTTNDGPADLCTGYTEPTKMADFNSRSFLVAGTMAYVCDGRKKDLEIEQKCYSTVDGSKWIELDPRLGSMLGYDSEDSRVYGVSSNGLYYMSSADGDQWETSVPDDVTTKKASLTFKSAKKVPLDGDINLNSANPHADYTDGTYGATFTGLKKLDSVWIEKFTWNDCC